MTSFDRPSLLGSRYAEIAETSAFTYDDDDLVNYAEFLKNHVRYKTGEGFVDSTRRVRTLNRQQDQSFPSRPGKTTSRAGLLDGLNRIQSPSNQLNLKFSTHENQLSNSSNNLETKRKDYEKQMRSIEEQMIKAKQDEREAKRLENDIKKEQRTIRHSFRDLDVDTTKKRYHAEKNLSKNLGEKDQIERQFVKIRGKQTKERKNHLVDSLQSNKDKDRRNLLVCDDLARQYRTKTSELDLKHQQLTRIHSEFEQKIQQKEVEENRIRKELRDIALALSLEAQKAKNDMNDFLSIAHQEFDKDLKTNLPILPPTGNETDRRRHSIDGTAHRSILEGKNREAFRRIGETKNRLDNVYARQRQLNVNGTISSEQEKRTTQLKTKINEIDQRRVQLANQYLKDRNEERSVEASLPSKSFANDFKLKQHEDQLKNIQKVLTKNEQIEHEIRQTVKEAEFQRRKKEQEVQKLRDELIKKKREDAKKIQEAIERAEKEEKIILSNINKEKSKLHKFESRREHNRIRLNVHHSYKNETRFLLKEHERQHERLVNVHSQSLQSLNTI